MIETKIKLDKFSDVQDFVKLCVECPGEVSVSSGRWVVSGKSIMGIYSLDLSKDLNLEIDGDIPLVVREGMKKFIVY